MRMNMTRNKMMLAAATTLLLASSVNAFADCRSRIELAASPIAQANDISGKAEVRAEGARQRFKVSVDARVPDGTTFAVFTNGALAGSITIALGDGELELSSITIPLANGELELNNANEQTLPAGVSPVCSIQSVEVKAGDGTVLLSGNFF